LWHGSEQRSHCDTERAVDFVAAQGQYRPLCTILPIAAHIPCRKRRFHGRRLIIFQENTVLPAGMLTAGVKTRFKNLLL
jgi:hypothetical protein